MPADAPPPSPSIILLPLLLLFACAISSGDALQGYLERLQYAARISLGPENAVVESNTKVSFFCRGDGNPVPAIVWRRNSQQITESRYVVSGTRGFSSLRIEPVRDEDNNSNISCHADNGVDRPVGSTALLIVLRTGDLPSGFPAIVEQPRMKAVERGRVAQMSCKVAGDPFPAISWLRDMLPVDVANNARYRIATLGNPGSLMIENSSEDDEGKYECVARNSKGVVHSKAAHLYVKVRRVPPHFSIPPKTTYRLSPGGSINITCVAVGYPMPEVTWRNRYHQVVPLGENLRAPIGLNVLELTDVERTENYTCVAVSTLGNVEITTTILVKDLPPRPDGLRVTNVTAYSVALAWNKTLVPADDEIRHYIVQYRPKYSVGDDYLETAAVVGKTAADIDGLEPHQEYEFRALAVNTVGRGPASFPVEVQTNESGPTSAPLQVQARALSQTQVLVQWQPPEKPNGKITQYHVYFTMNREQPYTLWNKQVEPNGEQQINLNNLQKDATYYVMVQAMNSKGFGPISQYATVLTKQGIPGQPMNVQTTVLGPRKIEVEWAAPLFSSDIVSYVLSYNNSGGEGQNLDLGQPLTRWMVNKLHPDTLYSFRVAAKSHRGQGAFSRFVQAETTPSVPSGSPRITELSRDRTSSLQSPSLVVRWDPPNGFKKSRGSQLNSYRISWQALADASRGTSDSEESTETEEPSVGEAVQTAERQRVFTIRHLRPYTEYRVTVAAGTPQGFGPESEPEVERTAESGANANPEDRVPSAPVNVRVEPINSTAVRISWQRPLRPNGVLRGYYIYKDELLNGEPVSNQLQIARQIRDSQQLSTIIAELKPNTEYSFKMNALNNEGDGEFSKSRNILMTGLPPHAPENLVVSYVAPLTASLHWDPPLETFGLPVLHYSLRYRPVDHVQFVSRRVEGDQPHATVTGLLLGKKYEFRVAAVTDEGVGKSAAEKISTPDGRPSAEPVNLRYRLLDGDRLEVSWDPPPKDQRNGQILLYVTRLRSRTDARPLLRNVTEQKVSYERTGSKNFSFQVAAATSVDVGPSATLLISNTTSGAIKIPKNVFAQPTSNTTAVVTWDPLEGVENYEVRYIHEPASRTDHSSWHKSSVGSGSVNHLQIDGLSPNNTYAFCVAAIQKSVAGDCSRVAVIERMRAIHQVKDLVATYATFDRIMLQWEYDGPGPVTFYVNNTGYKDYLDQDLKREVRVFRGHEIIVAYSKRQYELSLLRPSTRYEISLGTIASDRRYWPQTIEAHTAYRFAPFVDQPEFVNTVSPSQVAIRLKPASEEYGPTSHYWLIVVPLSKPAASVPRPLSLSNSVLLATPPGANSPYIAANISAEEVTRRWRLSPSNPARGQFVLGDSTLTPNSSGNHFGNPPLARDGSKYVAMLRAFVRPDPPTDAFLAAPAEKRSRQSFADSEPSSPFSGHQSGSVKAKTAQSAWLIGPIIAILIMTIIVAMLIIWWMRRNQKQGSPARHGSITKVALGSNGGLPNESSKLLLAQDSYDFAPPPPPPPFANGTGSRAGSSFVRPMVEPLEMQTLPTANGVLPHPPVPITELEAHIDRLKANDNMLFSQEYESIETGQQFTWEASSLEVNKPKNRYANVIAYDHSRVLLTPIDGVDGSDYINANYIDGYRKPKSYIATQGPLPETFSDFWRMVWEVNSVSIVMLTRLEERSRVKCDQYWPMRGSQTYGHFTVTLLDTLDLAHYTVRTLRLQRRGEQDRDIRHLQFTAWPDHGVPSHPTPFLMFLKRVKSLNPPEAGPIVTHCSAGIGRTGALIAIDCLLDRLRFENTVDAYSCVAGLRAQRSYMVQTEEQYVFIHDAVFDAVQSGSTEVPAGKLFTHIQALMQLQPLDNATGMELEFRHLSSVKLPNARCSAANRASCKPKNRLVNSLPFDGSRVCLDPLSPGVDDGSDYINASWIDGYRHSRSYIAAQGALPTTVDDFWRMLWQHNSCIVVMLTKLREMGREKCCQYWPGERCAKYGQFAVEPIAEYNMPQYVLREFKMTDTQSGASRTVRQFQYTEWPEQGAPKSGELFVEFVGQVHKTKEQFGADGPIAVHCSAGLGRTGVFVCLSIVLERMRYENVVDIFTTVKLLRTQRPSMVQSEDQYHFCYQAALEYLGSFDHYAVQCE